MQFIVISVCGRFMKEKRGKWLFEIRTKSCDYDVLKAVAMKVRPTALWNMTPCSVVEFNFFFGRVCCIRFLQ